MILLFCSDRVTRELNNKELWRFWRHASRGAAICIHSIVGKHKTKIHFDMFNIVRFLWHPRIMQMGQSLEAFLQWKSLVSLLFGCSEAVSIDLFPCFRWPINSCICEIVVCPFGFFSPGCHWDFEWKKKIVPVRNFFCFFSLICILQFLYLVFSFKNASHQTTFSTNFWFHTFTLKFDWIKRTIAVVID